MPTTLSALILAKNEAAMIANCLDALAWCDEVIVIDNGSTDATAEIATRAGARVITQQGSFAQLRTAAFRKSKTDWVLYIDADERVTPELAQEIRQVISQPQHQSYGLVRKNILYGSAMAHGGWEKDMVVRLFQRDALKEWAGDIHEHAVTVGSTGVLREQLWHFTHRSVIESLYKSAQWTPIEAELLAQAGTAAVTPVTLIRKGVMEVWRRAIWGGGYKDGMAGWVEAITQGLNRILVYMQLWERQQKPSIPKKYEQFEHELAERWHNSHRRTP